jgi:hypothetical protein
VGPEEVFHNRRRQHGLWASTRQVQGDITVPIDRGRPQGGRLRANHDAAAVRELLHKGEGRRGGQLPRRHALQQQMEGCLALTIIDHDLL